jgi:hypothetical protein
LGFLGDQEGERKSYKLAGKDDRNSVEKVARSTSIANWIVLGFIIKWGLFIRVSNPET